MRGEIKNGSQLVTVARSNSLAKQDPNEESIAKYNAYNTSKGLYRLEGGGGKPDEIRVLQALGRPSNYLPNQSKPDDGQRYSKILAGEGHNQNAVHDHQKPLVNGKKASNWTASLPRREFDHTLKVNPSPPSSLPDQFAPKVDYEGNTASILRKSRQISRDAPFQSPPEIIQLESEPYSRRNLQQNRISNYNNANVPPFNIYNSNNNITKSNPLNGQHVDNSFTNNSTFDGRESWDRRQQEPRSILKNRTSTSQDRASANNARGDLKKSQSGYLDLSDHPNSPLHKSQTDSALRSYKSNSYKQDVGYPLEQMEKWKIHDPVSHHFENGFVQKVLWNVAMFSLSFPAVFHLMLS